MSKSLISVRKTRKKSGSTSTGHADERAIIVVQEWCARERCGEIPVRRLASPKHDASVDRGILFFGCCEAREWLSNVNILPEVSKRIEALRKYVNEIFNFLNYTVIYCISHRPSLHSCCISLRTAAATLSTRKNILAACRSKVNTLRTFRAYG